MDLTCTQDFESAKIIFTYDENKFDIEPENLGILWYDEENQFYEVMETELNEQNHTISMTTTHFSEYTVVDLNAWFKAWEEKIDYGEASITANNASWQGKVYKKDECYFMDIKYYLLDVYEFPVHWDTNVATDNLSTMAHQMHEYGLAKEYKIIGVYNRTVAWKKGTLEKNLMLM